MQIGEIVTITPYDNPVQYDPDWRSTVAKAVVEFGVDCVDKRDRFVLDDLWIKDHIKYLNTVKKGKRVDRDDPHRVASLWVQGSQSTDVRFVIEPLLLTSAPIDIISKDIGGDELNPKIVEVYEKLYFNIRKDDGRQKSSCYLRKYFALPRGSIGPDTSDEVVWKVIGSTLGYTALVTTWLWSDAHGLEIGDKRFLLDALWQISQSIILVDALSRRVSHFNLAALLKSYTDHVRAVHEISAGPDSQQDENRELVLYILNQTAPTILSTSKTVDELKEETELIQARLAAQNRVNMQEIVENELFKEHNSLDELIKDRFKNVSIPSSES